MNSAHSQVRSHDSSSHFPIKFGAWKGIDLQKKGFKGDRSKSEAIINLKQQKQGSFKLDKNISAEISIKKARLSLAESK